MESAMYPDTTKELARKRREIAPDIYSAFRAFGERVFADGALPSKTKQLIAVAVAHVTQCPYCIRGPTELAVTKGASEAEIERAEKAPAPGAAEHRVEHKVSGFPETTAFRGIGRD